MAKNDYQYAEMLNLMREQGKKDNPITLQIGVMQSEDSVKIGDLILNAEDLYINDKYVNSLQKDDLVVVEKLNDNNMYVILARVVRL